MQEVSNIAIQNLETEPRTPETYYCLSIISCLGELKDAKVVGQIVLAIHCMGNMILSIFLRSIRYSRTYVAFFKFNSGVEPRAQVRHSLFPTLFQNFFLLKFCSDLLVSQWAHNIDFRLNFHGSHMGLPV